MSATLEQIEEARKNGADWCRWGWAKDTTRNIGDQHVLAYPLAESTDTESQCPNPHKKGIRPNNGVYTVKDDLNVTSQGNMWGLTLYGIKPLKAQVNECKTSVGVTEKSAGPACVVPFSSTKWSQYS